MSDDEGDVYQLTEEQITDFREAFDKFDTQKTGEIPTSELGTVMRMLGHNLKKDQLLLCIEAVDGDGSGSVDFDEFLQLMAKKTSEAEEETEMREAFRILDKDNQGTISVASLKEIIMALDEEMSDQDVDDMIAEIDEDDSGTVDYEEFKAVMTGGNDEWEKITA